MLVLLKMQRGAQGMDRGQCSISSAMQLLEPSTTEGLILPTVAHPVPCSYPSPVKCDASNSVRSFATGSISNTFNRFCITSLKSITITLANQCLNMTKTRASRRLGVVNSCKWKCCQKYQCGAAATAGGKSSAF
eukprot:1159619-Pelagomonas_calceolata.AAC.8